MKYILSLVLSTLFILSGCANDIQPNTKHFDESSTASSSQGERKSDTNSEIATTTEPTTSGSAKSSSASAEPLMAGKSVDLSSLDNTLIGYGQGVNLDSENRPLGAIDFNEKYSKYNAISMAKTDNNNKDKKTIYLTFDQGYENGYTAKILDTLKKKKVKATFFILQDYAEKNPELVKRMIDEGHTVGNHSVSHPSMPEISVEEAKQEIMGLHNYVKEKFGYEMTEFRPPKGEFSERTLQLANECGYKTVMWSFAYADWDVDNQPDKAEALEKVTNAKHNGAIYLLHSVSKTNAEILGDVIDNLKKDGYTFKSF